MSRQADAQPAVRFERSWGVERADQHSRQRGPDLARSDALGQRAPERDLRQELEGAGTIRDRPADGRERALRPDEALLHRGIAPGPGQRRGPHRGPRRVRLGARFGARYWARFGADGVEDVEQHRLDDEAVVVVPVEFGPVAVVTVAEVPLLVLPQGVVDARPIPRRTESGQAGFDHRREQQPVAERRRDHPGRRERGDEPAARRRIEAVAECRRRAEDRVCQERGVDERLAAGGEVQRVGRGRVDSLRDRAPCQIEGARAGTTLGGVGRRQRQPRRQAGEQAAERFEMGDRRAVGASRLFDRHRSFQRAGGEMSEHRIGDADRPRHPGRALGDPVASQHRRRGVDRRGCTRRRGLSRRGHAGRAQWRHKPCSESTLDKGSAPHVAIF
jgi:hypothetical protein